MRLASLLVASLLASVPSAVLAQGMDVPGAAAAPAASPESAQPAAPAPSPEGAAVVAPPPSTEGAPAVAPPDAAAAKPVKSAPYFGFSFGTGKGTLYSGGSSVDINDALGGSGSSPTTMNMQLRSGWGTGDLLFGMQLNWTRTWIDVNGTSAGLDFKAFDVVGTWWDQNAGLYARVGIGPSSFTTYVGDSTSDSVSGVELMVGFGFTMGSMGVGMDMFRQSYDAKEAGFDSVTYVIASLSLDMY
jgi:hypothetical protein